MILPMVPATRDSYMTRRCEADGCGAGPATLGWHGRWVCRAHDLPERHAGGTWTLPSCGCSGAYCGPCIALDRSGVRVLVLGERAIAPAPVMGRWPVPDAARRIRASAFRWGPGRQRLHGCGLRWHGAANLLPPAPADAGWSDRAARDAARHMYEQIRSLGYDLVIAAGVRVRRALEQGGACGDMTRIISVPHPSGRNRKWLDADLPDVIRGEYLHRLQGTGETP